MMNNVNIYITVLSQCSGPTSLTLRQHCINVIEAYRASVQCRSNLANMRRCREPILNKIHAQPASQTIIQMLIHRLMFDGLPDMTENNQK